MLSHLVSRHRSHRLLLPALPALDLYLLSLLVGGALPRYLFPVCRLRLIPRRLTEKAYHPNCLPKIGPQAHPIKQANQGIKRTLDPAGVLECNHATVRIEEVILVPSLLFMLAPILLALYHCRHPVSHHQIHHHNKYGGV